MKKLFLFLTLVPVVGFAAEPTSRKFINNGTYLTISNNAAFNYDSAPNMFFVPFNVGTNVQANVTNRNNAGLFWQPAIVDCALSADANGNPSTGVSISVAFGTVSNYNNFPPGQSRWPAVSGFTNAAGAAAIPTGLFTTSVAATNISTFVFQRSADGYNFGTTGQDKFQFTVVSPATASGAYSVWVTNPPSAFLTGTRKIRLLSITTDNSSTSPGITFNDISLNQFVP